MEVDEKSFLDAMSGKNLSIEKNLVAQAISNLLENASKFTPAGGTVWLHAEPYMWERRSVSKAAIARQLQIGRTSVRRILKERIRHG